MRPTAAFTPEKHTMLDKATESLDRVFILGDTTPGKPLTHFIDTLKARPVLELELVRACLSAVYNRLPKALDAQKLKLQERAFENAPLNTPLKDGYKILSRLGSGQENTVYFLNYKTEGKSWAVGIKRGKFSSLENAQRYAKEQEADYREVRSLYSAIPGLVPEESRIIYRDHNNSPNVMFFREFVGGQVEDVFKMNSERLRTLLTTNSSLRNQFLMFTTITVENADYLKTIQLDLIGENNLVIVGDSGCEKLVFLEPHTRYSIDPTENNGRSIQRITEKIEYLTDIAEKIV